MTVKLPITTRFFRGAVLIGCLCVCLPQAIAQAEPPSDRQLLRIAQLIEDLDSDRFEVRKRAEQELETLAAEPQSASLLAAQFQKTLAGSQISFEVRSRLSAWLNRLPPQEPVELPTLDAIPQLLDEAIGDAYSARATATDHLNRLAARPQSAIPLLKLVRGRLADASLPVGDYKSLLRVYERARGTWLLSDPSTWQMPPVAEAEINGAVQQLIQAPPATHRDGGWGPHAAARRYLLDLLCEDERIEQVRTAIDSRLGSAALDESARERLEELLQWTQPALVAEIWKNRHQIAEQHLFVDVPRQSLNATRPSHFSRINDRTAYCVSGQNLTPGEYPVGVAIAHPESTQWMCHLVNLPTPRRRMRYAYDSQRDEQVRLAELTERTLQAYIAQRAELSELQILLLDELHHATVSRMIGDYFLAVDDRRVEPGPYNIGGINASHHARVCYVLTMMGTREVAPKLIEALGKQRFLPPRAEDSPHNWPWIAALAIARRDPWDKVDAWLGGLLDRREPLVLYNEDDENDGQKEDAGMEIFPELGATAAGLLLDRHEQRTESFDLQAVSTSELRNAGCPAYRFRTPTARQQVIRWWEAQKNAKVPTEKAP